MKSLKLIGFLLGLMVLAGKVYSAEPTPLEERAAASRYTISHSSVNIGSMTAVAVVPAGTGFREITLSNYAKDLSGLTVNSTTVYYKLDGLVGGTTVWGQILLPNSSVTVETQNAVRAQLATNASSVTIRVMLKTK